MTEYTLGAPVDYDPFAEEEEKEEFEYELGEGVSYNPFEVSEAEAPAEAPDIPSEYELGGQVDVNPFEAEAYAQDPQSSDLDETDDQGHSLWDIPRVMGKGAAGIAKTASLMNSIVNPAEWGPRVLGFIGDLNQNEALQAMRDFSASHGASHHLKQIGETADNYYDEKLTPAMKKSMAKTILSSGKEEGFWGEGITDPWKIGGLVAESIPSTIISMGGGAMITKNLINTGLKTAPKIIQKTLGKLVGKYGVNKVAGVIGGAAGEGGYSGLENANSAFEEMMATDQKELVKSKTYREIYNSMPAKFTDEQKHGYSRKILSMATGGFIGAVTAVTTGILGAPSGAFLGKLIGGEGGKSLWGNLLKGAFSEGFLEEMPQSGVERLVNNVAQKLLVDPEQQLMEGVGEAMASGAVAGFAMGGGMAAVAGREGRKEPSEAKDLLTDGADVTAKDLLLGKDVAEDIRGKVKGKKFGGAESIEAEEEAAEFGEEELEKFEPAPLPEIKLGKPTPKYGGEYTPGEEVPSDRTEREEGEIPGKEPQRQKPVKAPAKKQGPTAPVSGGVVQKPKADEGKKVTPEQAQFDELVASLSPEQEAKVRDLIKDTKMPIKERLGLMQAALATFKPVKPKVERRAEPKAKRPTWDEPFRALISQAKTEDGKAWLEAAGKRVRAEDPAILELAKRMGETIEPDSDIDDVLQTVYGRIMAGMEPRKKASEMTAKELREAANTDYLTGLRNKQAFDLEDKRKKHVASIDLDSLKYINDNFGHQTGDAMLINFGRALKPLTGVDTYHVSGDEFIVQHDDATRLEEALNQVKANLNKNPLTVIMPDGKRIQYEVQFSYGKAQTIAQAEEALHVHKATREVAGERAGRGEIPPGLPGYVAKGERPGVRRKEVPEKRLRGRDLFTPEQLSEFDRVGIDVSKVPAKYKAEALQQLQFKTKHEGKTPEEYDAWVKAQYAKAKGGGPRKAPMRTTPPDTASAAEIKKELAGIDKHPTEGQKKAGNYKKGHFKFMGFNVTIENPAGEYREGTDPSGKKWRQKMANSYGYFSRTEGKDGDEIDLFLGNNPMTQSVFIVHQVDPQTKKPDEDKVMLGFSSAKQAKAAYLANYEKGWQGFGKMTAMLKPEFADWLDTQTKARAAKKKAKKPVAESARTTAIGVITGGKVDQLEEKFDIGWASQIGELKKGSDLYYDVVGIISGGKTDSFIKAGLSVSRKKPKPAGKGKRWIEGHLQTPERADQWWTTLFKARAAAFLEDITREEVDWTSLKAIVAAIDANDKGFTPPAPTTAPKPEPSPLPAEKIFKVFGENTNVITPGNRRGYKAQYAVVEADDLIPSHNPRTFQKNPGYPEGIQERTYHTDTQEQGKVISNAQHLSPKILLSDDPTPVNGPPIITGSGVVLGGNSRTMSIQRAYGGKKGQQYKNALSINASKFGIAPADVSNKKKPVLVRSVFLIEDDLQTLHRMATDFNKSLTQGISQEAETASMGRNISIETIEKIGLRMANRDLTIRELLGKKDGLEILDWLINDDAISATEKNRFINRKLNLLNAAGKIQIEKGIFGSIIDDAELLDAAPKSLQNKIGRSLPSLARIKARGDQWDITPEVKEALELATKAQGASLSIREFLRQTTLFEEKKEYSDVARSLAFNLTASTQTMWADKFKRFAADAMADVKKQQFLFAPKPFSQAFKDAFGAEVEERGPRVSPEPPSGPEKPKPWEVKEGESAFELLKILRLKDSGLPDDPGHQGARNASAMDEITRRGQDKILSELNWPMEPDALYYRIHNGTVATLSDMLAGKPEPTLGPSDIATLVKYWNPLDPKLLREQRKKANVWRAVQPKRKKVKIDVAGYPTMEKTEETRTVDVDKWVKQLTSIIAQSKKKPEGIPEPHAPVKKPQVLGTPEYIAQQSSDLADWIVKRLEAKHPVSWRDLFKAGNRIFGGSQAQGVYSPRDAYDAMELGVNRYIMRNINFLVPKTLQRISPEGMVEQLKAIGDFLPTQSKRTKEQEDFQQYSTPPFLAYVANWVAGIGGNDVYLEPSAGIGGLAIFGRMSNAAKIFVNELSKRRLAILNQLNLNAEAFNEDAIQLNNVLPDRVKPTVIVMNPPFSSTAGRLRKNFTKYGAQHVEQALKRLEPGGRLVAIVGRGMEFEAPTFRAWWTKIRKQYTVRANIGIDGGEYRKYGTTFDNRLLVIDKSGPTVVEPVSARVLKVRQLPDLLQETRNVRSKAPKPDQEGELEPMQPPRPEAPEAGAGAAPGGHPPRPEPPDLGAPETEAGTGGRRPPGPPQQPPGAPTGPRGELPPTGEPGAEAGPGGHGERPAERPPQRGEREPEQLPPEKVGKLSVDELSGLIDEVAAEEGLTGAGPTVSPPGPPTGPAKPPTKPPTKPTAETEAADIAELADIINSIDTGKGEVKEAQAPYGDLMYPPAYAKAKPILSRTWQNFIAAGGTNERIWLKDILTKLSHHQVNPEIAKNWVIYFYQNDLPENLEPTPEPEREAAPEVEVEGAKKKREEIEEKLYTRYTPTVKVKGAKKHPTTLDESAALGDTDPPPVTYKPSIPQKIIDDGLASDAQLEAAIYAGQAHEQLLPSGARRGFMAGHGTGVGKGRIIASIILDNWNKGRKKAIWISEKWDLLNDAKRDLGYDNARKEKSGIEWGEGADSIFPLKTVKSGQKVKDRDGILFSTYSTLSYGFNRINERETSTLQDLRARINQIVEWAGADYDGVIAFDESHNMSNSLAQKGDRGTTQAAQQALAGVMLQARLPNARVVYVSATGATEVRNLAYAERLGLWGEGTAFPNKKKFIKGINAKGLAAMELVARDLKARGLYLAPTLSYDGVNYDKIVHVLDDKQRKKYDELARAWQVVLHNINAAMGETGAVDNPKAKQAMWSAFWGGQQRFFNQLITTMQMGAGIKHMEKELEKGHSLVLQLVNHGGSQLDRALDAREEDEELEDLELGPKAALLEYIENAFPVQQYEPFVDENGNEGMRLMFDSEGKPVINRDAQARKEEMLAKISAIKIPGSPLDLILHHFGTDKVAEITGRKNRLVYDTETGELIREKWSDSKAFKDKEAFLDDEKRILVFSEKGGTGASYHADLNRKNQKKRIHYLVQPGWRADKAIQGLGRTHRSNQAQEPEYFLLTTDLDAQKRFISSIARRLDQLGALTKGQRQTGSQGIFQARDNMESDYASTALNQLYHDIADGVSSISIQEFENQTALNLTDEDGRILSTLPPPTKFMNRLLTMEIGWQNKMFGEWSGRLDRLIDAAKAAGTLDIGIETVQAISIDKAEDRTVNTDEATGAKTRYVRLEVENLSSRKPFEDLVNVEKYYVNNKSKKIWAASQERTYTDASGNVVSYRTLQSAAGSNQRVELETLDEEAQLTQGKAPRWVAVKPERAAELWNKQYAEAAPTLTRDVHLMTGALLPIWERLTGASTVYRMQTDEGERFLGLVISQRNIDSVLDDLGVGTTERTYSGEQLVTEIAENNATVRLVNRWKLKRSMVSGEERIEIKGPDYDHWDSLRAYGVIFEKIGHQTRYFVPTGAKGAGVIDAIIKYKPVADVQKPYAGPRLSEHVINEPSDYNKQFGHAKQVQMSMFGGNQLNLFTDQPKGPQPPASRQVVNLETTGDISHFGTKVRNPEEAAGLVSFLIRKGAEEAYTVAVDDKGTVIQIHKVSKGGMGSATVPAIETGGTLLKAPGASKVYFIHQHPSRDPQPSREDIGISKVLKSIAAMRDIELIPIIMVDSPARYLILDLSKPVVQGTVRPLTPEIKMRVRKGLTTKLPVSERFITPVRGYENAPGVSNSQQFRKVMDDEYHDMEGILLLDGANIDLGFVPWAKNETMKEFTARLISEAERHNARAAIINIKTNKKTGDLPKVREAFLKDLVKGMDTVGLQIHDISVDGSSLADRGVIASWRKLAAAETQDFLSNLIKDTTVFSRKVSRPKVSLSVDEVQATIDPFTSEMKTKPPITIVRRQSNLPEGIHAYLRENGGQNDIIVGAVDGGRVYLVAENIENENEALRALFHETMGHFGIRAVLGNDANKILDSIYIAKRPEINPIATEYGFNLKTVEGRRAAADEWLAREAETNPKSKWIDRVIALIRKWIRKINPNLAFSDAEIRALIARARQYVRSGQKTSVFPSIAFDRLPALADTWHSHMSKVLETIPPSGTGSSYLKMINQMANSGKIKAEELEWSGLRDWLKEQPGKIKREDLLAWLAANNVTLKEINYYTDPESVYDAHLRDNRLVWPENPTGGETETGWQNPIDNEIWSITVSPDEGGLWKLRIDGHKTEEFMALESEDDAKQYAEDEIETMIDQSITEAAELHWKHDDEKTGLTEHEIDEGMDRWYSSWWDERSDESIDFEITAWKNPAGVMEYKLKIDGDEAVISNSLPEAKLAARDQIEQSVQDWDLFGGPEEPFRSYEPKHGREQLNMPGGENYRELLLTLPGAEVFKSELHWPGVKNPVAHVRFNERVDRDGKRVLFLEEVQSDWHQKGRKQGYGNKVFTEADLEVKGNTISLKGTGQQTYNSQDIPVEEKIRNALAYFNEYIKIPLGVPEAPFKKTWPMLILKRMVRYAAENDFDSIAWTPGQVQADRYDLSQYLTSIRYERVWDDAHKNITGYDFMAINKEGREVLEEENISLERIEEIAGKEIADKVQNMEGMVDTDKGYRDWRILADLDLKVGGKGMIGFYDKMLPSQLNQLFGKAAWGKAKVEPIKIGPITPVSEYGGIERLEEAESMQVLSIPITPEMKAKALYEGMPLFMRKRQGAIDVVGRLPENVKHRFAQARGVPKLSWIERAREKIQFVKSQRYHFPDLYTIGDEKEEDQLNDVLRQHQEVPETAKDQAARKILEFTKGLSQDQYEVFRIHVILSDMIRDIDSGLLSDVKLAEGETLPFGFANVKEVRDTFDTFEQLADQEPSIRKAIRDRRSYINGLVRQLTRYKLLKKEVLKHKDYFHHQVLSYWAGNKIKTIGASSADVRTHWRPWMAARKGSMMDYNTEYVEAEFAALAQQLAQLETAKTLERVKNISDIYRDLKTAAKFENLKNFYVQAAKQASAMFGTKITVAELRADHELDPLFPYRQNIAMATSQLEKMAYKDTLEVDSEWDDVVDALAERHELKKAGEEEMGTNELADVPDGRYFAFLSYLIDKKKPGASWAATTFKAIQGRNKYIKTALGDRFVTFRQLIPDGYTQWKPDPGKGWFWANTITDDILQKIIAGEKAIEDRDVRQMLAKGRDLIWVIPDGLASTMDNFRRYPDDKALGRMADWMQSAWKQWILINPRRWLRYNVNNMSGDLDITLAYAPGIVKGMKQSFSDLRKWHKRQELPANVQAEIDNARRKGVIGSGFAVQEVEDVLNIMSMDKYVREVLLGEKPNIAMRYWEKAKGTTVLRENLLRLAAYRWFRKALADGKKVYGASKPHEVDSIPNMDDKAAKLARELIGDYGNISSAGQYIRRRLIPFYSWLEINAPRYVYLMRNLRSEDRHSDAVNLRRQVAGIASKKVAIGAGKLFLKANILMGAVLLWNMLMHRDEWEELGEAKRRQMHLILGRSEDGTIQTIRFQGALSDALAWFGLEDWPADVADVVKGSETIQDKLIEAPTATVTKLISGIRPEPKLLFESLTKQKIYPDPFTPRPVRDTLEHVLRTFSLDSLYRLAAGKPGRGKTKAQHMLHDIKSLLVYSSDPGEQAYYDTRKTVFDWLDKQADTKKGGRGGVPTKRGNALYYYRQALKYGDLNAAKRYLDKYYDLGGTQRTLRGSIKRAHPLASIPAQKRYTFRQAMTPKQQDRLKIALKWYDLTYKKGDFELRQERIKEKAAVNQ